MTVKQIVEELSKYPEDMEVFVCSRECEEPYSLAESVKMKVLHYDEELDGEGNPIKFDAIIIDEQ